MSASGNQSQKCRIAILGTRGIPARYGGFETFAEKLAIGLSEHRIEVTVFCESGGSPVPDSFEGVKLRYVSAPALGPLQTILYDARCLWMARNQYDVVYMLGYGAALFCLIPRLWKTRVWINPDGLEWARAKWGIAARTYFRLMEWTCLRVATRIIADASAIADSLVSRHGKLPDCSVIPYGCEIIESTPSAEPLSEWGLVKNCYYLVVCRLEPENHVLEMLLAFQKSRSSKQLIVVGNHLYRTKYVRQLCAVQDMRIRMIGPQYDQTKLKALRFHSFAYLHGHSVGGTNPSLLEAMGCGNLIFAHRNPFNLETLGPCGFYFENSTELARSIDRAEGGDPDLVNLKEAARARARANYRWPDIVSKYLILLKEVTDDIGKGSRMP
jgi:glycosyltransferase involved in cell wall biosynthesis